MPRPKRVFDPMTGSFDGKRSSEPMPVREVSDHAYVPSEPQGWADDVSLGRPGPYRARGKGNGHMPVIRGRRIA